MKKMIFFLFSVCALLLFAGCQAMNETARKVSDDLGNKALQAHAFVDIWKITPSDPASNSSPTGKKITVIGDVKSIPLTSTDTEVVKDYAEYRKTKTPAWYNSDNVTEEETFIGTGDNAKEVAAFFKAKREREEAKARAAAEKNTSDNSDGKDTDVPTKNENNTEVTK